MIPDDQQQDILHIRMLIGALHRAIVRSSDETLAANHAPVSHLQLGLMMSLRHQAQTLSELSRVFGLDPSTLVPTVESLVKKGFVERGVDPNDRRRSPISVTPDGMRMIRDLMSHLHEEQNDAFNLCLQGMGAEKSTQLVVLLRELLTGMPEGGNVLQGMAERLQHYHTSASASIQCLNENTDADEPSNP